MQSINPFHSFFSHKDHAIAGDVRGDWQNNSPLRPIFSPTHHNQLLSVKSSKVATSTIMAPAWVAGFWSGAISSPVAASRPRKKLNVLKDDPSRFPLSAPVSPLFFNLEITLNTNY
jgi:hypothetical protein